MAGQDQTALDALSREVTLRLSACGGRVFAHSANTEQLNRSTIELKCWWMDLKNLFSLGITIGDEKHEPLHDGGLADEDDEDDEGHFDEEQIGWRLGECPILLSIYEIDEHWLASSAANNDGMPVLGRLQYYPRIQTADGVVNDKRPSVTAWTGMGAENFRLIRERLLSGERHDFELGITVEFPPGSVKSGWAGREIHWDGLEALPISSATIVWSRNDWNVDREGRLNNRPPPEPAYVPPLEHVELLQASSRLETAIGRLVTPLWLTAAAVIAALYLRN